MTTVDGSIASGGVANLPLYGSIAAGNNYFASRLNSDAWVGASDNDKEKALIESTRLIDRLNFRGDKAEKTQTTQFPRGTDTSVPEDIRYATYEQAIQLLDGVDPDLEYDDLRTIEDRYATVKTTRDTEWTPEHVQAGITSSRAWHLLKPFLRDCRRLQFRRG